MNNIINQTKNIFNNSLSKMFSIIIIFDIVLLGFAKENTIHLIVSIVLTLMATLSYLFIVLFKDFENKKNLYIGAFGLYEAFHCILLFSLRVGKNPMIFFIVFGLLCIIAGIFVLILEFLFGKSKKFKNNSGAAIIVFAPFGCLGVYLHRMLKENNFPYIPELLILLFGAIFILFYICIISYRTENKTGKEKSGDGSNPLKK